MIQQPWQRDLQTPAPGPAAAGLAWLADLAVVRFTGADAVSFLQGYLTCDTSRLEPGRATPTALCSLKGRVVMNGWCALQADGAASTVLLILHRSLVERLATFLKAYLAFSRTTLVDGRDDTLVLASLDLVPREGALVMDERRCLYPVADLEAARNLWRDQPHIAEQTWIDSLCIDGVPLVSQATSETFLPQMLDLQTLGAIDFAKGCYLGQEVVARAQHRGQVKRHLRRLRWQGAPPRVAGEVVDEAGQGHGTVLQFGADSTATGTLLAVLRDGAPEALRLLPPTQQAGQEGADPVARQGETGLTSIV